MAVFTVVLAGVLFTLGDLVRIEITKVNLLILIIFCAIGFYNEADTFESNSILIYSKSMAGLYIQ
jgi:hypothetical protein